MRVGNSGEGRPRRHGIASDKPRNDTLRHFWFMNHFGKMFSLDYNYPIINKNKICYVSQVLTNPMLIGYFSPI